MLRKIRNVFKRIHIACMNEAQYINHLRQSGVKIGEGCSIAKSVFFGGEPFLIKIGDNVRLTRGVQFITHDGGLWTLRHMGAIKKSAVKYGNISIGNNCNISWNVTIMPNVHIGNNCVIAAGAVVTHNVPDGEIWGGVPARKIESVEEYLEKVKTKTVNTFNMPEKEKKEFLEANLPELFI